MASEIPPSFKKSVRAVLLSKLGGVLVSQFAKDYKALVQEQLPYKSLGFDHLEDFFTAMPDVVRLEYCKKDMAYRVFGIGDADTYMSSWIKKSQDPNVLSPKSRRKANRLKSEKKQASGPVVDDDDDGPQIDENNRYSVMYPRKKTPNFTVQDVKLKFQDTGDVVTVHIIERWIFIRYWKREEAIRAYDMFHEELGVKYPASNKGRRGNMNQSNNNSTSAQNGDVSSSCGASFGASFSTSRGASFAGEDIESTSFGGAILGSKGTIPENKKRNDSYRSIAEVSGMNQYQVYVGNLANDIKESDLDEIVGGRTVTRVCLKRSKDGIKVVGFISFTSAKDAEDVIASWDSKTFHGRNLLVRPGKQSQDNSRADDSNNSSINWKCPNSNNNESLSQLNISTNKHTDGHNGHSKILSPRQVHCTNGTNITIQQTSNVSSLPTQVLIKNPVLSKTGLSPNIQQKSSYDEMPPLEPLNACHDVMPPLQPMNSKNQITIRQASKPQNRSPREAGMSKKPSPNQKIQQLQSMPPLEPMITPLESMPPLEQMMPPLEPIMPPLEPMMSPLVPAIPVLQPMRQPASSILPASPVTQESEVEEYEDDCPTAVFVGNFPAGTTDKELYALFKRYGVFKVEMVNNSPRQDKGCTKAFVTVQSLSNAVEAILDLDQTDYFDRNIKVAAPHNDKKLYEIVENKIQEYMSDSDSNSSPPSKSSSKNISRNLSRSTNGSNISYFSSYTDVTDLESEDAAALLETYGYIKTKVQASKISQPLRQGETVTLSVTAWLIEQYYFVQNGSDMEALRDLQAITNKMQNKEYHLGRTKGLGRCVALYKKDWYRAWILREDRNNHLVKVFYIDYGNICIIPSKDTSIVSSWVWDLAPQARPVRIEVGSKGPYEKELVDKVITATVTSVKTVDKCPVYDVVLKSINA